MGRIGYTKSSRRNHATISVFPRSSRCLSSRPLTSFLSLTSYLEVLRGRGDGGHAQSTQSPPSVLRSRIPTSAWTSASVARSHSWSSPRLTGVGASPEEVAPPPPSAALAALVDGLTPADVDPGPPQSHGLALPPPAFYEKAVGLPRGENARTPLVVCAVSKRGRGRGRERHAASEGRRQARVDAASS